MHAQEYRLLFGQLRSVVALDYNIAENAIYWTDVADEQIKW